MKSLTSTETKDKNSENICYYMYAVVDFTYYDTTDSFKFKENISGETGNDGTKCIEMMVLLKYLSIFWRTLAMSLIECEVNLILNWYK